jgi:hypothetical protein
MMLSRDTAVRFGPFLSQPFNGRRLGADTGLGERHHLTLPAMPATSTAPDVVVPQWAREVRQVPVAPRPLPVVR